MAIVAYLPVYIPSQTPKRKARGSGCKPILSFVLAAEILQSNQITERLIMTAIIDNDEYQHPVPCGRAMATASTIGLVQCEKQLEVQQGNWAIVT